MSIAMHFTQGELVAASSAKLTPSDEASLLKSSSSPTTLSVLANNPFASPEARIIARELSAILAQRQARDPLADVFAIFLVDGSGLSKLAQETSSAAVQATLIAVAEKHGLTHLFSYLTQNQNKSAETLSLLEERRLGQLPPVKELASALLR